MPEIAMTIAVAFVIGGLIGSVGIGGVLLVPWLTGVVGLEVRDAVAIAMASYLVTGAVAIVQAKWRAGPDDLKGFWPLMLATLPGAFLGAIALAVIPDAVALALLAVFLVVTGAWFLVRNRFTTTPPVSAQPPGVPTGLLSGFASSLTGTGGPAVLIPILLWRGVPLLAAVALGQMVQLPIAIAATTGNLASGPLDWMAALAISAALAPGVVIGRWAATKLPLEALSRVVAVMLIATGVMLAVRAL